MTYEDYQILDLTKKEIQEQIGKIVQITFGKPRKLKGYNELQYELSGIVENIGLAINPPHLPVNLRIKDLKTENEFKVKLFDIKRLETE